MVRRETPGAKIVLLVRNVLAPLGAILILFSQIPQETGAEVTWAKIAATAFGFVLILVLLNGLNLAVFVTAKRGTWRNRLPSIFVDIARARAHRRHARGALRLDLGSGYRRPVHGARHLARSSSGSPCRTPSAEWSPASSCSSSSRSSSASTSSPTGARVGSSRSTGGRRTSTPANGILVIPERPARGLDVPQPHPARPIRTRRRRSCRFATDDPPQRVIDLLVEVGNGLPELAPGTRPTRCRSTRRSTRSTSR